MAPSGVLATTNPPSVIYWGGVRGWAVRLGPVPLGRAGSAVVHASPVLSTEGLTHAPALPPSRISLHPSPGLLLLGPPSPLLGPGVRGGTVWPELRWHHSPFLALCSVMSLSWIQCILQVFEKARFTILK